MSRSLFLGATIWGGAACAPARGWLLVEGDRIAGVGGESEPAPPADRVLQLPGCHVLPGFVDVHLHLSQAAWFGRGGDGSRWRTVGEALNAVASLAAGTMAAVLERRTVDMAAGQAADGQRTGSRSAWPRRADQQLRHAPWRDLGRGPGRGGPGRERSPGHFW
jgi:cytosine/adenosine deaminase-related metal-dependent hydrolase